MSASVAELAILPGTSHLGVIEKTDVLVPILAAFFDKDLPAELE